ncbi:MAG: sorbosone dehydrogenase, partial [Pirellulales bacterium]|nr:sorbosone dehydrogenase [Pirellulales bacterium]
MKTIQIVLLLLLVICNAATAQRDLKDIPDPDPLRELETFVVPDGFEVNLYAADPQIAKPIQMNFDEQGRLWIASSEVYPHIKPGQKATDKILVVEDRDRDGVADKTSVFVDGLLIPTGVVPGDGGCYVANSTDLIHFADLNGDLKADRQNVVLSGFGTEDTHHLLHTLRWGHDGALYMNQSIYIHSHVETPYGVKRLRGGGIWQFRPESMQLNILCEGFVNPWGHHFDRWGQHFATDGAYGEGINYVFPGAEYVTKPGLIRRVSGLNPGSPKHCGLEIISGRHIPESWQGSMVTNDFRAHRVCRFVGNESGSGYASTQEEELIKTTHVAFRPIDVKMGPDGAIYIADWYNPIIQHGEVDFRDERRDHLHGRIWRISAKNRPLAPRYDINKMSITELFDLLLAPEEWLRLHAKLALKKRNADDVESRLNSWLKKQLGDASNEHKNECLLEAMFVLQCIDRIDEEVVSAAINSDDHRLRARAVLVISENRQNLSGYRRLIDQAVGDEHERVRLEAVRALGQDNDLAAVAS